MHPRGNDGPSPIQKAAVGIGYSTIALHHHPASCLRHKHSKCAYPLFFGTAFAVKDGVPRSGAAAVATVEQFLIRGLGTACQVCVAGLPQPDSRRSALPLPKLPKDPPDRHQRPEAIGLVRNPDGREFSGTRKPRQHECITPIGLDVISGAFGSETTKILLRMKY
jgi:hypothetical protein